MEKIEDRLTDEELKELLKFNRKQKKKQQGNFFSYIRKLAYKFLRK